MKKDMIRYQGIPTRNHEIGTCVLKHACLENNEHLAGKMDAWIFLCFTTCLVFIFGLCQQVQTIRAGDFDPRFGGLSTPNAKRGNKTHPDASFGLQWTNNKKTSGCKGELPSMWLRWDEYVNDKQSIQVIDPASWHFFFQVYFKVILKNYVNTINNCLLVYLPIILFI